MIQVIKTPTSKQFYDLVKSSTKELLFCVPFIKKDVISHIINNIKPDVVVGVITYSNIARFANGSLDLEAIKMLLDKGFKVLNYQNLHAKIYLFDNEKALITSANLSYSALHNNYGLFDLIFTPRSSGSDVEIELFIIGTGSNDVIPVNVLKAKNGIFHLKTKKNKFFMKKIERGTRYKINLKLEVKQNYVWEVNISANE